MHPFKQKRDILDALKKLNTKEKQQPQDREIQCPKCKSTFLQSQLSDQLYVCPSCGHHYTLAAKYRLKTIVDPKTFHELFPGMKSENPLDFPEYKEKLMEQQEKSGLKEAVIFGTAKINGIKTVIGVMDNRFMMASMGTVVGEKITRAFEFATKKKLPVVIFATSGGARMQEGILSLFQMAKTSAAVRKHSEAGLLYISVMTHPTTGGVTASFASLGDIILAEPKALIGFAGPRVIEQTIGQSLPEGFQRAEYLEEHGFVDAVVHRKDLKAKLGLLLQIHDRRSHK